MVLQIHSEQQDPDLGEEDGSHKFISDIFTQRWWTPVSEPRGRPRTHFRLVPRVWLTIPPTPSTPMGLSSYKGAVSSKGSMGVLGL